ncbi:MAG: Mur ligase family protein, partial [Bacteroidota bacterium]|nr:Mur ligase family protein [Bacteroidota bacterium]
GLDAVVLGMHAKQGNPELEKAKELNLNIYSFPEFLYEHAKEKKRVVIGGSHGKTTITAMLMHVLKARGLDFDYLVGAQLEGFDVMVRLSDTAPIMLFEGDEYLTSALDPRPKFHLYRPHIALLSGIAWDHINVFPTFENYLEQFRIFIELIEDDGALIYFNADLELSRLAAESRPDLKKIPYDLPVHRSADDKTIVTYEGREYPIHIFGDHNLANLNGAGMICQQLGIPMDKVLEAMGTFKGAAKRLELVAKGPGTAIYTDFAHAPSKLKATINAVKNQFPGRKLLACIELHTYSSLSKDFLSHYAGTMDQADLPVVYFNPHAIELKKLKPIAVKEIIDAFKTPGLQVFNESNALKNYLLQQNWKNSNLLMMSSGDFDGIDLEKLSEEILSSE